MYGLHGILIKQYLPVLLLQLDIETEEVSISQKEKNKIKWKWKSLRCVRLCDLYSPWNSPGQNTVVGSRSLLQGVFPTQGPNPGLPHCRRILYQLSHQGSPRILEWVAYAFSSGSSWPRNWTRVSCIAGRFFTSRATREAPQNHQNLQEWHVFSWGFRANTEAPVAICWYTEHEDTSALQLEHRPEEAGLCSTPSRSKSCRRNVRIWGDNKFYFCGHYSALLHIQ